MWLPRVSWAHEQTDSSALQAPELARLQRSAQAAWLGATIRSDPAMARETAPTGKPGRQPDDSDAALQTGLTLRVLFGVALRQIEPRERRRVPSTPANLMTPSPTAALARSSRPARTPGPGSPALPGQSPAARPCAHRSASGAPSGGDGAATTAKAASRHEPGQTTIRGIAFPAIGCIASSCRANAWPRGISTVSLPSSRSLSPFSTAAPRSEYPSPRLWDEAGPGKREVRTLPDLCNRASSSSLAIAGADRRIEGAGGLTQGMLPFGLPDLNRRLPDGGLALGCLHEVAGGGNGAVDGAAACFAADRSALLR